MPAFLLPLIPYIPAMVTAAGFAVRAAPVAVRIARTAKAIDKMQSQAVPDDTDIDKDKDKDKAQAKPIAAAPATSATQTCINCSGACAGYEQALKEALYSAEKKPKSLGGNGEGKKGAIHRLCEWLHGADPNGGRDRKATLEKGKEIDNKLKEKNKPKHNCLPTPELDKEAEAIRDEIKRLGKEPLITDKLPRLGFWEERGNWQEYCFEKAKQVSLKYLGK